MTDETTNGVFLRLVTVIGLLVVSAFASFPTGASQSLHYHIGAWGDSASIGNLGVQAEIKTDTYG